MDLNSLHTAVKMAGFCGEKSVISINNGGILSTLNVADWLSLTLKVQRKACFSVSAPRWWNESALDVRTAKSQGVFTLSFQVNCVLSLVPSEPVSECTY